MKRFRVLLLSLLASLLLAEPLFRVLLIVVGSPYDGAATAAEWQRLVDPALAMLPTAAADAELSPKTRTPILNPYTGGEWAPDTGGVLEAFRTGFAPDEYTVVIVGGSVAAACALSCGDQLAAGIQADPRFEGKCVRVLNFAHPSYKQPQQLMRVAYLFSLGYRPNAIVNYDGFNEVALALQNLRAKTHPVYPPGPIWGAIVGAQTFEDDERLVQRAELVSLRDEASALVASSIEKRLYRSSILGTWIRHRLVENLEQRFLRNEALDAATPASVETTAAAVAAMRQLRGPDFVAEPDAVLTAGAANWRESSLSLHGMCELREIYYLHVLQPVLYDPGAKPLSEEERNLGPAPDGWVEASVAGYARLRAEIPALEAAGVRFIDATGIFRAVPETLFLDPCHTNQRGKVLAAEALVKAFLANLPAR